jgi:methionyl-tRNA formyltransferase
MSRLAFLGTPAAAVPSLRALVAAGHDVALVVSRADTRRSRRGSAEPSQVKRAALELGIEVSDRLDDVREAGVQMGVVVAYGRIIPERILDVVPMLNVHFSLLPRWRGAAPVERAILAGDPTTGVCVMRLEAGLDTGPVLARRELAIEEGETAWALKARLADLGAELLVEVLADGVETLGPGEPQDGEVTYAAKIDPDELELHFENPAEELARLVRVGKAWTTFRGARLIVLRARPDPSPPADPPGFGTIEGTRVSTSDGTLELLEVQPEGRRRIDAAEWLRGARVQPGERLGGTQTDRR